MGEVAHESEVLASGEVVVDCRVLAGEPDAFAHGLRVGHDVDTEHRGPARVGPEVGGEDPHRGRLPGAVRAEQTEDGSARDFEADAGEGDHLPVVLLEVLGRDRDLGHLNHAPD